MKRPGLACLSIPIEGKEPPTEQRLFKADWNDTRKGRFLFDEEAARAVMAAYQDHGIDLMFDLEHLSLDDTHPNFDPDARGWARLELRKGELWAVDIKWTPDGDKRLREKRQRYLSPAFEWEKKSRRVLRLINVAITSLPATDQLEPLVAASERSNMDPKICEALGLPPDATLEQVLEAIAKQKGDYDEAMKKLAEAPPPKGEEKKPAALGDRKPAEAEETSEFLKELGELRTRVNTSAIRELLRDNRRKCTPAVEKWALRCGDSAKVEEVLALMPELPAAPAAREGQKKASGEVTLTDADRRVCKLTQRSEAEFLAEKKRLAAVAAERSAAGDDGAEED